MFSNDTRPHTLIVSRTIVATVLVTGFALVFAAGALAAWASHGVSAAHQRAAQTQHALGALTQFAAALEDAANTHRSGVRRDRDGLRGHATARARVLAELATIAEGLENGADLRPVVAQLRELTTDYLAQLGALLAEPAAENAGSRATTGGALAAQRSLDELRQLVASVQRNRLTRLAADAAFTAERTETIQFLSLALIVLGGSLAVAVSAWLLRRVRDLEGLLTVCAWTRRVQWQGKWLSFEEYLAKRFNLYCTHGICEEAAEKMREEAANTPIPADFLR